MSACQLCPVCPMTTPSPTIGLLLSQTQPPLLTRPTPDLTPKAVEMPSLTPTPGSFPRCPWECLSKVVSCLHMCVLQWLLSSLEADPATVPHFATPLKSFIRAPGMSCGMFHPAYLPGVHIGSSSIFLPWPLNISLSFMTVSRWQCPAPELAHSSTEEFVS